jgi:hypothetical protein
MSLPKPPLSAWVTAGALAAMTLFVFAVLQDYGPEAAIRRFHTALAQNDARGIMELSYPPSAQPGTITRSAYELSQFVRNRFVIRGARVQLYAMSRRPDRAAAVVTYLLPEGAEAMTWILRKSNREWKVDTAETVRANARNASSTG